MFKKFVLFILFVALVCAGVFFSQSTFHQKNAEGDAHQKHVVIAITQIAPHPSLDKIRQGIVDSLEKFGFSKESILFQNAQGSPATALQIAQKFVSEKVDVIVPITTPSAQAAVSAAKNSAIPIIFSAVSDPFSAKLIGLPQVAGVSDLSPVAQQVELIEKILGKSKKIGVLYNGGEANSLTLVKLFEEAATEKGMTVMQSTVSSTNDVSSAAILLISKGVDAIFIPNDNTVISALESVLRVAKQHKIPVFTADPESVTRGALGSIAFDQYDIGQKTGELIIAFLQGKSLADLGVQRPNKVVTSLNKNTARDLNITIPPDLNPYIVQQ